jgi:hypothetical protein
MLGDIEEHQDRIDTPRAPHARSGDLAEHEWIAHLTATEAGRIVFPIDDVDVILPVRYRFVERAGPAWLLMRARPDSLLRRARSSRVAFVVDGVDAVTGRGWSVMVRGTLHELHDDNVAPFRARFDPGPRVPGHDTWLFVKCASIVGRHRRDTELGMPDR